MVAGGGLSSSDFRDSHWKLRKYNLSLDNSLNAGKQSVTVGPDKVERNWTISDLHVLPTD